MRPGKRFGLSAVERSDIWRRWKAGETLSGVFSSRSNSEQRRHITDHVSDGASKEVRSVLVGHLSASVRWRVFLLRIRQLPDSIFRPSGMHRQCFSCSHLQCSRPAVLSSRKWSSRGFDAGSRASDVVYRRLVVATSGSFISLLVQ
jgi:hypothetical protein